MFSEFSLYFRGCINSDGFPFFKRFKFRFKKYCRRGKQVKKERSLAKIQKRRRLIMLKGEEIAVIIGGFFSAILGIASVIIRMMTAKLKRQMKNKGKK